MTRRRRCCVRIDVQNVVGAKIVSVAVTPWVSGGIVQRITKRLKRQWPSCTVRKVYSDDEQEKMHEAHLSLLSRYAEIRGREMRELDARMGRLRKMFRPEEGK